MGRFLGVYEEGRGLTPALSIADGEGAGGCKVERPHHSPTPLPPLLSEKDLPL